MTWIVGLAPHFGYSILISDVCVTFKIKGDQKKYFDCLQKIYPLGPYILGGFAGSVKIGFHLLSHLSHELSRVKEGGGWSIEVISNTWWPRLAKRIFKSSEQDEKKLHSQIILAGIHPNKKRGDSPWAYSDIYTFSSPDFKPQKADANGAIAIGSGQTVPKLVDLINSVSSDFSFQNLATSGAETHARMLAHSLSTAITENNVDGISKLFQVGIVYNQKFIIAPHEYNTYSAIGEKQELKLPRVAKKYSEFIEIANSFDIRAKSAIC